MGKDLIGKRVAILATDGFEQTELLGPKDALIDAGAEVSVISPSLGEIRGWNDADWGRSVRVDATLESADPNKFDALVLPGGVMNPDKLRNLAQAMDFILAFYRAGKPIGAICHAPWLLIEAGIVKGRAVTSWPSLRTDLTNAGAIWQDAEVIVDQGIVTSRKPNDIPAFVAKMVEEILEGVHPGRAATVH